MQRIRTQTKKFIQASLEVKKDLREEEGEKETSFDKDGFDSTPDMFLIS